MNLAVRRNLTGLSEEIVQEAYAESVLGPANRTYFDHFYERLARDFDPEKAHVAKRLILEVARLGNGFPGPPAAAFFPDQ